MVEFKRKVIALRYGFIPSTETHFFFFFVASFSKSGSILLQIFFPFKLLALDVYKGSIPHTTIDVCFHLA